MPAPGAPPQAPDLAIRLMLDQVDLATAQGDTARLEELLPELCRRTEASGDVLLEAMGCNRAGWAALGRSDLDAARERYERAWALAELHEDPEVESRTAAGLALVDTLAQEPARARVSWGRALELSRQLHDRALTLLCLDGVAVLLVLAGEQAQGLRLAGSTSAVRRALDLPREAALDRLHELVVRRGDGAPDTEDVPVLPWAQAVEPARQWLTSPR